MAYNPSAKHTDVRPWLDAGLAAHRAGDLDRAIASYRHALALAPDHGDALNLLGTALLQRGAAEEALPYLERAAASSRNNPQLLANLGQCCLALQRYGAAYEAFRKAGRIAPEEVHFQLGAAGALALQGKLADAENILRRQAKRTPRSAMVWLNLGHVMRDGQRRQDAIDCYEKAVALEPAMADARCALGSALHSKLRFDEAEKQYRACLELAPDHLLARFNLASVLMDLGRFAESEAAARELARRVPEAADAHRLVGSALGFQTRLLDAHACYSHAAALEPESPKAAETLAMSFMEIDRAQEGLRWFARARALGVDPATAGPLLAGALLADGAIHEGWTEYRQRHDAALFRQKNPDVPIAQSPLGEVAGKHVCIVGEQGLGDEIFFLRYAPRLAQSGARLTYRAGAKVAPLLARTPFLSEVIAADAPLPAADAYVLAGDLPHALSGFAASPVEGAGRTDPAVPEHPRHLSIHYPEVPPSIALEPLAARTDALRERLAGLGPPPYIGLTWRAGTLPEQQRSSNWVLYKTVPLDDLAAVLSRTPGTLLALQRAPDEREIAALALGVGRAVHDLSALNEDLEDMLALLSLIDDYVGVSNTNMHLRAAVGKAARVLVPAPAEWRWMRRGRSAPWFPGFSIYRQTLQGDWRPALAALESDLAGNRT